MANEAMKALQGLGSRLTKIFRRGHAEPSPDEAAARENSSPELVVPRPPHFATREYELLDEDDDRIDMLFTRLKAEIVRRSQGTEPRRFGSPPPWRVEFGRIAMGRTEREYCFVQQWSEQGWLIERTPIGWMVAPADKNAITDSFLRTNMAWDHVSVYVPKDDLDGLLRLKSSRLGSELISYPVYEDSILADLGLKLGVDA